MNEPTATTPVFELKDYRQPLVTSLGVILGFLVGFLAQWVSEEHFALASRSDWLVFIGCIAGAAILLRVLFRMLSPPGSAAPLLFYRRTLRLYISGIAIAFLSLIVAAFL